VRVDSVSKGNLKFNPQAEQVAPLNNSAPNAEPDEPFRGPALAFGTRCTPYGGRLSNGDLAAAPLTCSNWLPVMWMDNRAKFVMLNSGSYRANPRRAVRMNIRLASNPASHPRPSINNDRM